MLSYEYNLFEIERTQIKAKDKLAAGKAKIEVETKLLSPVPDHPASHDKVERKRSRHGHSSVTAPMAFTANDCLDFGSDLGSPSRSIILTRHPSNSTVPSARVRSST